MKLALIIFLFSSSFIKGQEFSEYHESNRGETTIRSISKPYPYLTVNESDDNSSITFYILSENNAATAVRTFIKLDDGQVLLKAVAIGKNSQAGFPGYTEYKLIIPINESDISLLSKHLVTQFYFGDIPVNVFAELSISLKERMELLEKRKRIIIDSALPSVVGRK
jgi:hypothetical protein